MENEDTSKDGQEKRQTMPAAGDGNVPAPAMGRWKRLKLLGGLLLILVVGTPFVLEYSQPRINRDVARLLQTIRHAEQRFQHPHFWQRYIDVILNGRPLWARFTLSKGESMQLDFAGKLTNLGVSVVPVLSKIIQKDSSPNVRLMCAEVLGNFHTPDVVRILIEVLQKESVDSVRVSVVHALGKLADTSASPIVAYVLRNDAGSWVRDTAAAALGNMQGESAVSSLANSLHCDKQASVRAAAAQALGKMKDPQAVAPLLAALRNEPNLDVRCGAFFALAKIGDPETFPELIRLLRRESDPPLAQHAIIRMLGKIKDSRAIMPLITASLVADEVNIPSDAVKALGNLADPQVESVLIAALENDSAFEVRRSAAALLGKIGGTKAVPVLISAVERDAQNDVKEQAIRSLGLLGDMRALPILTCQLQKGVNIAYASTEAIGAIGDSQSEKDLLEALKGASIPVTAGILQSLGETGGTNGLATLMHWGRSVEHHTICGSVASAMGKIGDARAMPVLEKMLINDSSSVRVEAAMALGHIGDTKAIPLLVERSKTCADEELIAVTFALAELRATNAVEYLNAVMVRSRGRAKLAAACSLAFLSQTNAIPFLDFNLDAKDPWQRFISISGLLYLNRPESMACLKKVLKDKQMGLRQLVSAASEGGASMAMAGLLKDKDADMRYYAARALLLFDNPATLDALEAACKDRDPETRSAARLAFRRIKRMHNHPAGRAESLNRITPSVF